MCGFDSHPSHWWKARNSKSEIRKEKTGRSSNGRTPVLQTGNQGSTPCRFHWIRFLSDFGLRISCFPHMEGSRITVRRNALLTRAAPVGGEGSIPSPSATAPVVKRRSCRASNAVFRVRILAGALLASTKSEVRNPKECQSDFRISNFGFRAFRRQRRINFHVSTIESRMPIASAAKTPRGSGILPSRPRFDPASKVG